MPWQKPTNLNDWLGLVFRHKKKLFFPTVAVMIIMVWMGTLIPKSYYAEARFSRINDPAMTQMGGGVNTANLNVLRQKMIEELAGRPAIEQLISDLQLTRNLPHNQDGTLTREGQLLQLDLVAKIRSKLNVNPYMKSVEQDLVSVGYNDEDPVLASKIVNQLVENYIHKTGNQLHEMLLNSNQFFSNEVAIYTAKVEELEQKKLRFELDNPGLQPNDPQSIQTRLVELRAQLDSVNQQVQVQTGKREKLQQFITKQPDLLESKIRGQNPLVADLMQKKSQIEEEIEQHKSLGRKPEHPLYKKALDRVADVEKQIKTLDPEVDTQKELVPNTSKIAAQQSLEILSGELVALERQREQLSSQLERYEVMNRNFFVVRNEYGLMDRQLSEARGQLTFWDDNLRRTKTALTSEVQNRGVRLSFEYRAPEVARPSAPSLSKILMGALAAGLAVGVGMVVLFELLDGSFHSVDQAIEGLKLPVLGAVNEIVTPTRALRQRILGFGVYPAAAMLLVIILTGSMFLVYMSLQFPEKYALLKNQVKSSPIGLVKNAILGS